MRNFDMADFLKIRPQESDAEMTYYREAYKDTPTSIIQELYDHSSMTDEMSQIWLRLLDERVNLLPYLV